jgi:putative hemolysin
LTETKNSLHPDVSEWFHDALQTHLQTFGPVAPLVAKWLSAPASRLYNRFRQSPDPIFSATLQTLRVEAQFSEDDRARIPKKGPVVVIANHPYRGIEVPLLGSLLQSVRDDIRFMVTSAVARNSPMRDFFIPLEGADRQPAGLNRLAVRAAVSWLRSGGLVVVFPSGGSATRPFPTFRLTEKPWTDSAATLAKWGGATVVPVFIHGCNHWTYYAAELVHRELRYMVWACSELSCKRRVIRTSVGIPIDARALCGQWNLRQVTEYLRARTFELSAS